jgi:hypothetical protein
MDPSALESWLTGKRAEAPAPPADETARAEEIRTTTA